MLGYFISSMIQAFVPKAELTKYMGKPDLQSVSLATFFGAASSSCSFAALAAARALVIKGAHWVAAVAFMFASTNLVIELGILILIFLGWQYLVAEIIGGVILIAISSIIIKLTYPHSWLEASREKLEQESGGLEESFNWRERIKSGYGWRLVGKRFVDDWKMAWEDILIGFTIAGFVAILVPESFWTTLFLVDYQGVLPNWVIYLENAMIAPFVAAATFIGSMGNIPLATVLDSNGVLFAGIMGFIYSDLMVPPLVHINAKYYGWRVALYIAGVMFVSIVLTALILNSGFVAIDMLPQTDRKVSQLTQFKIDYTFWMNIGFVTLAGWLIWLYRKYIRLDMEGEPMDMGGGWIKKLFVRLFIVILTFGLICYAYFNLMA